MLKRIISGIIGIIAAVIIINQGGLLFLATISILTIIGMLEFYRMVGVRDIKPFRVTGVISGLILVIFAYLYNNIPNTITSILPVLIFTLFLTFVVQLLKNGTENAILNVSTTFFGIFYLGGLFAHVILLRQIDIPGIPGIYAVYFALTCTWSTDTCAYFLGKTFGKRPLAPQISPNKTMAGFLGGILGSVTAGLIFSVATVFNPYKAVIIAFIIGIVGQLGDLFESAMKRDAEVKDSGDVIPGHGGILDRFDSGLFTLALTYYLIHLLF